MVDIGFKASGLVLEPSSCRAPRTPSGITIWTNSLPGLALLHNFENSAVQGRYHRGRYPCRPSTQAAPRCTCRKHRKIAGPIDLTGIELCIPEDPTTCAAVCCHSFLPHFAYFSTTDIAREANEACELSDSALTRTFRPLASAYVGNWNRGMCFATTPTCNQKHLQS